MCNRNLKHVAAGLFTLLLACSIADAQKAEVLDRPGVTLTYESLDGANAPAVPDTDVARLVSLYVAPGEAPSPFTPAGPFRATFEGDINVRLRTYVRLSAMGRGNLTVSVAGKSVLEAADDLSKTTSDELRLNKGKNHFVVVYQSPKEGPASLRLLWSSKTWLPETMPPTLFTHDTSPGASQSIAVRDGRFLFAQYRCVKCHHDPEAENPSNGGRMPELNADAPSLTDAGARLNREWVVRWVTDPRSMRPDSHMPRLFKPGGDPQPARDVAAYLGSLGGAENPNDPAGDAKDGGRVFSTLDCIACHTPPDAPADPSRVPLRDVASKFKAVALREYLINPQSHYAWNPMPNFRLTAGEAANLAAYIRQSAANGPAESLPGDANRGKMIVQSVGCLNCHQIASELTGLNVPALARLATDSLAKGCLAESPVAVDKAPQYNLSEDEKEQLRAFLRTDRKSLQRQSASEFAEREIGAMRCTACHARDGAESLLFQGLDAESQALQQKYPNPPIKEGELLAADQRPPQLTWAGEKLRPEWMGQFIGGQIPYKPRYFLRARMPSFPARAGLIATGLAQEHGCAPSLGPEPKADPQQAEIGRQLCSKIPNQGFSCVQCHAVAGTPPFAPFEAPSINFQYVAERLRHDYFLRWMHDPQRIDPNTKMPRFDDSEGKTGLPTFDGDSGRQFEAIWCYLQDGPTIKPPPG